MGRWGTVLVPRGVLCVPAAEAAGPWRAQVVDAESGRPLSDVAVLAVWHRHPADAAGQVFDPIAFAVDRRGHV